MIPVVVFALSVTVLVVVANIRGNLFQSSLLSDETGVTIGSGSLFHAPALFGSGSDLQEFPVFTERTETYLDGILGENRSNTPGFYFPHIYSFAESGKGLVNIAFAPSEELMVEKSIRLEVFYPSRVMQYVGEPIVTSSGMTMTVDAVSQPNQLIIEMIPGEGTVWQFDEGIDPFIALPMVVQVEELLPNTGLQLRLTNAEHVGFDNSVASLGYVQAPVDIMYYAPEIPAGDRGVLTGEVRVPGQRGVLTMELPGRAAAPTEVTNTAPTSGSVSTAISTTVQAFRLPVVTQDQTRISPPLIREKSRENVFVYLSITDPDGMEDIQTVEMDLSSFGLAARAPLVQVSTGPKYSVYGGNFILPDDVMSRSAPYEIPYTITDGGSNVVKGSLPFVVRSPATEGTVTTTTTLNTDTGAITGVSLLDETPVGASAMPQTTNVDIETDLNGDGKVDNTDLAIYLFTFNLDRD